MTRSLVTLSLLAAAFSLVASDDAEARCCCRGNRFHRTGYSNGYSSGYSTAPMTSPYASTQYVGNSNCQPAAPATTQPAAPNPPAESAPAPVNSKAPAPAT